MKENIVKHKSFEFSKRIVKLYSFLCDDKKEYIMSKQLMRCGTSIGANIYESVRSVSKKDFANKMAIALKEASECEYWIELLYQTGYLTKAQYDSIIVDCCELNKILISIVKQSTKAQIDK